MKYIVLSLGIAVCMLGSAISVPAAENAAAETAESQDAVTEEAGAAEENAPSGTAEVTEEKSDQTESKPAGQTADCEVIEITPENWEEYFEILPVHKICHYTVENVEEPIEYGYNSFELVLKDEYFRDYMEKSGWHIDDQIDPDFLYTIVMDEEFYRSMEEQGAICIPAGADITAKVHFEYDGETLGLDDPQNYSGFRYPLSYSTQDMNPIAFDRETSINMLSYAATINANRNEESAGSEDAAAEGDETAAEEYTESSVYAELNKDYAWGHLAKVGVAGVDMGGVDTEPEMTGEILDHFTITMTDISGTLTIWK